jgi:hypothetical protein
MCPLLAFLWGNKEWCKMVVIDFLLNCGLMLALLFDVSQRNFASGPSLNIHTTPSKPCIGIGCCISQKGLQPKHPFVSFARSHLEL